MTAAPCVSVIVPTYSRRDYLYEALDSLLAQTFHDIEVIVGNDGGPDYIAPVKARVRDPRIVWADHPQRLGLLGNMLDGFGRARGRYLATLHDDDLWDPGLLAALVPALDADPTVTVAFCDHYLIDDHGTVDARGSDHSSRAWGREGLAAGVHRPFHRMAAVDGTIPIQCAAVFRRDALDLDGFPREANTKYDRWLAFEMARRGGASYYVPQRLAYYRIHARSQTSTGRLENARSGIYVYSRFLTDSELARIAEPELRRLLAGEHYGAATALIRGGEGRAARSHLRRAVALGGMRSRVLLAAGASLLPARVARRL